MNPIERAARAIDRFHERHGWMAFPYAVIKKYSDDQAGGLAAQMTYYGFLALFPLLLVLTTVLGFVLRDDPSLQHRIVDSALAQFPIVGTQLRDNVHAFPGSGLALGLGLAGAVYGSLGAIRVAETAMNTIWDIPRKRWPNMFVSLARALMMLLIAGAFTVASAGALIVAGRARTALLVRIVGLIASFILNFALYYFAFRILTRSRLSWNQLWPGTLVAAVAWTALQSLGGLYVSHTLRNSTEVYGFFGIVIALLLWIYVASQVTLYAAELNAVRAKHLWPRRIVQPPLSRADERAMTGYAAREERRPEEHVDVTFDREPAERSPGRAGDSSDP
jgi:YihY family inner membrane protein